MPAAESIITILRGTALLCLLVSGFVLAQDAAEEEADPVAGLSEEQQDVLEEEITEATDSTARGAEAALNEDPEAQRRAQLEEAPILRSLWKSIHVYGSVRLHAINNFNEQNDLTDFSLGDGASRVGVRGELPLGKKWWLLGRAEGGFDVLDTFTPKAGNDDKNGVGLTKRMLYVEYRIDNGELHDGTPRKDELTVGIRWDFGHR